MVVDVEGGPAYHVGIKRVSMNVCLSALRRWLKRDGKVGEKREVTVGVDVSEGYIPVCLPIAGVMWGERPQVALGLRLRQRVILRREPENQNDPNAIRVQTEDGLQLGYIGRSSATVLAPYLDGGNRLESVQVTEIAGDLLGAATGVTIGFFLPEEIAVRINTALIQDSDWRCESGHDGAIYLLLDCNEAMLAQVTSQLHDKNMPVVRSGRSYRLASNGRQYRWFIRFDTGVLPIMVERFCREVLGIQPADDVEQYKALLHVADDESRKNWVEFEELLGVAETETGALKEQNQEYAKAFRLLQDDNEKLMGKIGARDKQLKILKELPCDVLKCLLPSVELLGDSLDILFREIQNCQKVLELLKTLESNPSQVVGKKVHATGGWFECHFNTGEDNCGRLYFKQESDKWLVLVSVKSQQSMDFEYLKKH